MTQPDATVVDDFDPDARELCPDGSCTGLLGPDGRCTLCGLGGGDARAPSPPTADTPVGTAPSDEEAAAQEEAFGGRELCPDGACLGVIGPDGRCPECGRAAGRG